MIYCDIQQSLSKPVYMCLLFSKTLIIITHENSTLTFVFQPSRFQIFFIFNWIAYVLCDKPIEEWQLPLKFSPVVFSLTAYYSERVEAFLSALQYILRTHHLLLKGNWWTYQGILRHQHCPALLGTFKQGFHNPGQSAQTDGPLLLWNKLTGGVEVKGMLCPKMIFQPWTTYHSEKTFTDQKRLWYVSLNSNAYNMFLG